MNQILTSIEKPKPANSNYFSSSSFASNPPPPPATEPNRVSSRHLPEYGLNERIPYYSRNRDSPHEEERERVMDRRRERSPARYYDGGASSYYDRDRIRRREFSPPPPSHFRRSNDLELQGRINSLIEENKQASEVRFVLFVLLHLYIPYI